MSANSGAEIYNGAIITGQTTDGQIVRRARKTKGTYFAYPSASS